MNPFILLTLMLLLQFIVMTSITFMQTFFYRKTIGLNDKWRGKRLVSVVILLSLIQSVLQITALTFASFSWLVYFIYITTILYPLIFMGGKMKERLLFGIINLGIYVLTILITTLVKWPVFVVNTETGIPLALILTSGLVIIIYGLLVGGMTYLNIEGKRYMPHQYWSGMIISASIMFITLFVLFHIYRYMDRSKPFQTYIIILIFAALIIWLMFYFIFYFLCRYFTKATEANSLAVENHMLEQYILKKQASDERIKILSHDLKHSLTQWRRLAEVAQDKDALKSIAAYESQLTTSLLINVENETANAIINQKAWEAQREGISFSVEGVFYKDLCVSSLDLCALLGNLLDNAIEAAFQTVDPNLRTVKLTIKRQGNLLILIVENGYVLEPVEEKGVFISRKKDEGLHAIGMKSVAHVVASYDGVVNYTYEDHWFKASLMVRGYKDVHSDKN